MTWYSDGKLCYDSSVNYLGSKHTCSNTVSSSSNVQNLLTVFSRADTNENMEVEDDVNKTLPEDRSEDEGEDTFKAGDSKFNYVSYIF